MVRIFYVLALLFCLTLPLSAQLAGEGRSFVLTLPYTEPPLHYVPARPRLILNSLAGADVRIVHTATGTQQNVTVPAGGALEVELDSSVVMLPGIEGTFRNSVQITSTAPITAAFILDRIFSSEAYGAIPDSLLDFEYPVMGTDVSLRSASVTVIAVEDSTTVTITPSVATRSHPATVPFTVRLNRGEVYQALTDPSSDFDVTGTYIRSDKPCGVISASICTQWSGENTCNPLLEQLPGRSGAGSEFIVGPSFGQDAGKYRLIGICQTDAAIFVNGVQVHTLKYGESYNFSSMLSSRITTSSPVLVMQLLTNLVRSPNGQFEPFGDPSWMTVSPVHGWSRQHQVLLPALDPRLDGTRPVDWYYFLQLALPQSSEPGLLVDGSPPIWRTREAVGNMVVGSVEVPPTVVHTISAPDSLSVLVYGYSRADVFGFNPAGVRNPLPMRLGEYVLNTCRDLIDRSFFIRNTLDRPLQFDSIGPLGTFACEVISPKGAFTIPARDSILVRVRMNGVRSRRPDGYLGLTAAGCAGLAAVVKLRVEYGALELIPPAGSTVDFPMLYRGTPFVDQVISIRNPGSVPVQVLAPVLSSARFTVASPTFPIVLGVGERIDVTLRFLAGDIGTFEGTINFTTADCPDAQLLNLRAVQSRSSLVPQPVPDSVRLRCGPKENQTISFRIMNSGGAPDVITDARIIGVAAGEFTLLTSLNGANVPAGGSVDVRVLYSPGPLGQRMALLRVLSGPGGGDTLTIPFDVRNDTISVETIEDELDFGITNLCDPSPVLRIRYVNTGTLPVTGFDAGITLQGLERTFLSGDSAGVGDTVTVLVAIDPATTGAFTGGVRLVLPECGNELFIPARGKRTGVLITYSADTVDFGVLPRCKFPGEIILTLENSGELSDTLDVIYAPASGVFDVPLPGAFVELGVAASRSITIRFNPASVGVFTDSLVLRSRTCGTLKRILLRGVRDDAGLAADVVEIDFGDVLQGSSQTRVARITNTSSLPLAFAPALLLGHLPGVRVVRPTGSVTLAPSDFIELELEYAPDTSPDTLLGIAAIPEIDPCSDTLRIRVRGVAVNRRLLAGLRWEQITGTTGDQTRARLFLEQQNLEGQGGELLLRTSVRFDASMLVPLGVLGASGAVTARITGDELRGDDRVVMIEARGDFPSDGVLLELRLLPALGRAESTPLAFDSVDLRLAANDAVVPIADTIDGSFTLLDICREGSVRLFSSAGFLRLAVVRPNPVRDMAIVEFETIENARARLVIYDMSGAVMAVPYDAVESPGARVLGIDVGALPSGMYWLTLETASTLLRRPMTVTR